MTSRLGRALGSWGIVGNPSLVTCHLFFISLLYSHWFGSLLSSSLPETQGF